MRIGKRLYAIRKPKDYVVRQPSDLVQVDGFSEFQAAFEEECWRQGIKLFVLPPRSPKLNGCVERAWWSKNKEGRRCVTKVLNEDTD